MLSKCTYDTVVHKLQRSAVMYACIFAFSLAVVDVECMRVVHVSQLRCKKTHTKTSEVKLNHRREILRCFTPYNIAVSHALNTYYFATQYNNIDAVYVFHKFIRNLIKSVGAVEMYVRYCCT